jgi:transposase
MKYLSGEAKKAIVKKVFNNKKSQSVAEVAKENNISAKTVRNYMKQFRGGELKSDSPRGLSTAELSPVKRFEHLVATAKFDKSELGIYCCERGLYSFQLQQWKEACMATITPVF